MTAYLFPGVMGLMAGLLLHWTGFSRSADLRSGLGLRRSCALRSGLTAVGWAMTLTALLCWLAVIDVDAIEVLPLSLGALLGGAILGIAAGLCGFTPMTAFAGLGGGNAAEALCVLVGCFAGTLLIPVLDGLLTPVHNAAPYAAATLFEVTLDEPWLLSGSFLGQGCAGLVLIAIALCIPSPRPVILTDAEVAAKAAEIPVPDAPAAQDNPIPEESGESAEPDATSDPEASPDPDSAADGAFVALLEGEEPLIVDTGLAEEADPSPDGEDSPESGLK